MAQQYEGDYPVSIDILTRAFEPAAIESRDGGGGKKFQYIAAETCIRRLNEATGNRWSFGLAPGSFIQFLDGGNDRNGNPENVAMAICELTIPGLGTRQGIGVQRVKMPVQNGEDMLKGVLSDALKKCATLFGVALELYGPELDIPAEEAPREIRQPGKPVVPQRAAPFSEPRTRASGPRALQQEPDGRDQMRANIERKCAEKGIPVLESDTYETIAESVNKALFDAGKGIEVRTEAHGQTTPGAILNALLALPATDALIGTGR